MQLRRLADAVFRKFGGVKWKVCVCHSQSVLVHLWGSWVVGACGKCLPGEVLRDGSVPAEVGLALPLGGAATLHRSV